MKLSVGEAKARLLEFGHRPRGPKAAIRRDPVTAAAVAFFAGVIISRFRPGPLVPLAAVAAKPLFQRVLPIVGRVAFAKLSDQLQKKGKGGPRPPVPGPGAQHRPYQEQPPFAPTGRRVTPVPSTGEWAMGPQSAAFSPPRARSQPPQGHRS